MTSPSESTSPTSPSTQQATTATTSTGSTSGGPPVNTPAAAPTAATIANSAHPDQAEAALEEPEGLTLRALVSSKEAGKSRLTRPRGMKRQPFSLSLRKTN